ncbi:hypothetical protein NEOLEDRAFT_1138189 [Neolentinus lepideus HHB14362 ss-1]|uniref:DASH complex subunit SPC19 n=1 Tax=Neolentinus lepideus HHB14362 ss-1 TaxID=1314782 RepID=A0A165QDQ2_9AGAM|nr:hypothetical protein NEOLEDRAFT_1138189 [Neolentinus lepideus HHB14362 ss-1]
MSMSRFSMRPRPRDSVFAGGPDVYRGDRDAICSPNLFDCVSAMESCCEQAADSQQLLRNGTCDLPRMNKVLDSQKVFLLVDNATVRRYKADLAEEIEPEINELISRAQKGVKALSQRQSALQTRAEAAQARQASRPVVGPTAAADKLQNRRLQIMVKQRERLEKELAMLQQDVDNLQLKVMNKG